MIFKSILLHNVDELVPTDDGGYEMLRSPLSVENALCEQGKRMNRNATGVELRFVINSGTARIKILCGDAYVYYGNIQAGWQTSRWAGSDEPRWIEVPLDTERMPAFERITQENNYTFSPQVVRIIIASGNPVIYDVEGDVEPPSADMMPKKTMLAYGSSITHGSLSLLPVNTWVYQVAETLGLDYMNKGYAGSCHAEPEMIDYLKGLDFDCAIVSLGANMSKFSNEEYEKSAKNCIDTLCSSHPNCKFIFIDSSYQASDFFDGEEGKLAQFRKILARLVKTSGFANAKYVCGLELMSGSWGLSGDLVHPNIHGVNAIANNLMPIVKEWFDL